MKLKIGETIVLTEMIKTIPNITMKDFRSIRDTLMMSTTEENI